jgi:hypothetical protein
MALGFSIHQKWDFKYKLVDSRGWIGRGLENWVKTWNLQK